jgi:putative chitinase
MNKAIKILQQKIGVTPDGDFGPKTARAFQRHFGLITIEAAHLLGQCHHESAGFTRMEENLNYSATRLLEIFPKYFNSETAKNYGGKKEAIANRVYANRMGNGPETSGDGFLHRGMGPLQLTGKSNQERFLATVGKTFTDADLIKGELAFDSAVWFFRENKIFKLCQNVSPENILTISRAVNIGNPNSTRIPHGMPDRTTQTIHYFKILTL